MQFPTRNTISQIEYRAEDVDAIQSLDSKVYPEFSQTQTGTLSSPDAEIRATFSSTSNKIITSDIEQTMKLDDSLKLP